MGQFGNHVSLETRFTLDYFARVCACVRECVRANMAQTVPTPRGQWLINMNAYANKLLTRGH